MLLTGTTVRFPPVLQIIASRDTTIFSGVNFVAASGVISFTHSPLDPTEDLQHPRHSIHPFSLIFQL